MGRLTKRDKCKLENGEEFVLCNHKEEDCNDSCMKVKECRWYKKAMSRLKEYEDLEEQGLLLRLPCKVGDTVYTNVRAVGWHMREKNKPYKAEIAFIGINGKDNFVNVVLENDNMLQFKFSDFGKTVFLTMEEAEKKLRNRMCEEM